MARILAHARPAALLAAAAALATAAPATAQQAARILREVGIDQELDAQVPRDLGFLDSDGKALRLGELFGDRPIVLTLVYYECPMLCTQVLNGLVDALHDNGLDPGADYQILSVTIDPEEPPEQAAAKKASYLEALRARGKECPEGAWRFLCADPATTRRAPSATVQGEDFEMPRNGAIDRLCETVGFRYIFDPEIEEYAHAAGLIVLTPDGRVSKYFYGNEFSHRDLRLALVEASQGEIGSLVDQFLLLCLHYDPTTGKYGVVVMAVVRGLGLLTVALLAGSIVVWLRRERLNARRALAGG